MANAKRSPFDPYGASVSERAETQRRLSEAENVLESYHHATDLLAEALQNAIDAIDAHTERAPTAPRCLRIDFDAAARRFSVGDTGVGLSLRDLELVFQPNVSFKKGPLARRTGRSRGEKGVGLSFLLLACDRLAIQTCDGTRRWDVEITGAASWARGAGAVEAPKGWSVESEADTYLGSERYTVVTLDRVDFEYFDRDLYGNDEDDQPRNERRNPEKEPGISGPFELEWILRTKTAVGNTASVFTSIGRPDPNDIRIDLWFTARNGSAPKKPLRIPYAYLTPEELLRRADSNVRIRDYESLAAVSDVARSTRNVAMRYVARYESRAGLDIDVYLFAIDGNAMSAQLRVLQEAEGWAPSNWQGFYVATRDMPTGISLPAGVIQPRGYERRIFALLQYDGLKLDVGRKTLAGGTGPMLRDVVRSVWDDVKRVVTRLAPVPKNTTASQVALARHIRAALALDDLDAEIPYRKVPDRAAGVAAIFHELLGSSAGELLALQPLTAGVFGGEDALIYPVTPNASDPLHALFGVTAADVVDALEGDETYAQTAALAVVWSLDAERLEEMGLVVQEAPPGNDSATHVLVFDGLAGREEPLRAIVLAYLLHGDS